MAVYKKKTGGFRKYVRKAKRAVGKAIKKRYYPNNKVNFNKIVSDVALVKRMLNAEKKTLTTTVMGQVFGQVIGNSQGFHSNDITPIPIQGNGASQRSGQSIKICSWHMNVQFIQQVSPNMPMNIKMYMFRIKGDPMVSPGTFAAEHWYQNAFAGGGNQIIDYNSQVNPNNFGDAELLYFKKFRLEGDTAANQTQVTTLSLGGKLQSHVRYEGDTNNLASGQIYLFFLADAGNASPTVQSTLTNIPVQGINTGSTVNYQLRWYYYDN